MYGSHLRPCQRCRKYQEARHLSKRAEDLDEDTALFAVDDSQDYGEVRYKATGWLDAMLYSLIFTMQAGEVIRAISLRKSTRQEQRDYAEEY